MAPDHYIIGRWESLSFEDLAEVLSVVVRIFQREGRTGGGVTLCQSRATHQIVMSFSVPVVGCLLKKRHTKGGHGHPRTPPPLATPLLPNL